VNSKVDNLLSARAAGERQWIWVEAETWNLVALAAGWSSAGTGQARRAQNKRSIRPATSEDVFSFQSSCLSPHNCSPYNHYSGKRVSIGQIRRRNVAFRLRDILSY
jgi:hypothetical protein